MNLVVKILLGALAAVVLTFILLIAAVTLIFEPNDYRPLLVRAVEDATGRDFSLEGDLGLKLLPCCGVSVGRATLGNPPEFPAEPLVSVDSALVSVKIWPLISRRDVQVGTISLEGADVRLMKLADGTGNWEFAEVQSETETDAESPISSLTIEGLQIHNGSVRYRDLATQETYAAQDIDVTTGPIGGNDAIPVSLSLRASDEVNNTTADVRLDTYLKMDGDLLRLESTTLAVSAAGEVIPTGKAGIDLKAVEISYDLASSSGQVTGIAADLALPGSTLATTAEVSFSSQTVTASGNFDVREADLRELLAAVPDAAFEPADDQALRSLRGSGRWSATSDRAEITNLNLQLDESSISGNLAITDFDSGAALLKLQINRIDLDRYQSADSVPAPASAAEPIEIPFDLFAELPIEAELQFDQLQASGIELQDLQLMLKNRPGVMSVTVAASLLNGRLTLSGSGNPAAANPALNGKLELVNLSPRQALAALDETFETADPNALTNLSGTASWLLRPRSIEFSDMQWTLDETRLAGSFGLKDFARPEIVFNVQLDRMDLDRYLAPESESAATDSKEAEIPADTIRELNLNGRLSANSLKIADLQLTNLAAGVTAAAGVLTLEPLTANLYGGAYNGRIRIDASGAQSQLSLDQELKSVQLSELLPALLQSDRLAGSVSLKLSGSGIGSTQTELLQALSGDFNFNLADGLYRGMDIAYEIENAQALLKRSARPETPDRRETPIQALAFSGRMVDGVLRSDNLKAEIPHLILKGAGGVNLIERTLDYQLNAKVLKSATNTADSVWRSLAGNTIPLTIKGEMSAPKVGVNMQGLIVETVKEKARNALLKALGTGDSAGPPDSEAAAVGTAADTATSTDKPSDQAETTDAPVEEQEAEPPKPEDLLKEGLRNLFKKPDQ